MTERAKKLLLLYYKQSRKIRRVSGLPPLTFKAKKAGTLKDYRIYGNTADGESVGDKTGNLFDGKFLQGYWAIADGVFVVTNKWICTNKFKCKPSTTYTFSFNTLSRWYGFTWYDSNGMYISSSFSQESTTQTLPIIYTATSPANAAYFAVDIGGYPSTFDSILPTDVTDLMLVEGSTPLPYEPYGYKVPVTVSNGTDTQTIPIYLPEPIKMVGDEAEYIDYGEQKQHRVRANYLQSSDFEAGAIFTGQHYRNWTYESSKTSNQYSDFDSTRKRSTKLITISGTYTISIADGWEFGIVMFPDGLNSGELFTYNTTPVTISNCTFAIQIRKNDVSDISSANISDYKIMLNKGAAPLPYEPYIENTDLDITLPALPTLPGTNTLTVGTEVQPSGVEIKGRIKAAGGD